MVTSLVKSTELSWDILDSKTSLLLSLLIQDNIFLSLKMTAPSVSNWRDILGEIPQDLDFTHIYEYLMKRIVLVLAKSSEVVEKFTLPVADKPLTKGYNFVG